MGLSRRTIILTASITGAVVLATIGGGAAYATYYGDRALPGTLVGETSVAGMSRDDIVAAVSKQSQSAKLTVDITGTQKKYSLSDLGVTVDSQATADKVLAMNDSILDRFYALFGGHSVDAVYSVDAKVSQKVLTELARTAGPAPVDATVTADPASGVFSGSTAENGMTIDTKAVESAVSEVAKGLSSSSLTLRAIEVGPKVTTEAAAKVAEEANALVQLDVTVSDTVDRYSPDVPTKAQWVTFETKNGKLSSPKLDRDKVNEWVEKAVKEANVAPTEGVNNVDSAGNVLVEAMPGKKGFSVNNASAVTDAIVSSLTDRKAYSGEFAYDEVAPTYAARPVLAGYQNYVYPAAAGEKWVDINLAASTLTAYEGYNVVRGPVPMNHGGPGRETVVGTFHVYLKYQKQDMGCSPEWPYCVRDVPWVTYFTGSYAMHGAPWADAFGIGSDYSSSGCINLPVDEARWMWGWSDMGTAVVTHH
ncbi:L,D-transpeptidase family protein [Schaalia sp. ZJ1691]|uniref:L,D-transpeptidase family protein n=1 Tax=Schaalia sp. ZJ1691 TaxID=2709404 RepID=UPI0013EBFB40|nr:L,D-transpeptidase family protein [Schaalia sp. ZJ1691]